MTRHVLMCPPLHYGIEYEINPWMHRANRVDRRRALDQWRGLQRELVELGIEVELVGQERGVPDMTFTANAGLVLGRTFIPSNFRYHERQAEAGYFSRWFERHGYRLLPLRQPHYWEGEGDVLWSARGVFAGFRFRTECAALDELEAMLGTPITRLELVDPRFYHLDTCFCPLSERRALFYPPAFSATARASIGAAFPEAIPVMDADALRFACNALPVDGAIVVNSGCEATVATLARLGYACAETPMDEFIKAGGSVKCLVLTLDGFTGIEAADPLSPE